MMARSVRDPREPASMKKIALSLFVIATSGAYVWYQSGRQATDNLMTSVPQTSDVQAAAIDPRVMTRAIVEPGAAAQSVPLIKRDSTADAALPAPSPNGVPPLPAAPDVTSAAALPPALPPPPAMDAGATGAIVADASPSSSSPQFSELVNVPLPRLRPTSRATQVKATQITPGSRRQNLRRCRRHLHGSSYRCVLRSHPNPGHRPGRSARRDQGAPVSL